MIAIYLQTDQDQFNQLRQTNAESLPSWMVPLFAIISLIGIIFLVTVKKLRIKVLNFIKGILEGCLTIIKLNKRCIYNPYSYMDIHSYALVYSIGNS